MKRKFRVRVKHFSADKYKIQYAYFFIIPIYKSLYFWFGHSFTSGTECWSTNLFSHKDAEKFAANLKSIEDIEKYYKLENEKRKDFYDNKEAYFKKNVPYRKKNFK